MVEKETVHYGLSTLKKKKKKKKKYFHLFVLSFISIFLLKCLQTGVAKKGLNCRVVASLILPTTASCGRRCSSTSALQYTAARVLRQLYIAAMAAVDKPQYWLTLGVDQAVRAI